MKKLKIKGHLDLFSGIGGFSLALKKANVEPGWIGFSDIDKFANELFQRRFPNAEQLNSITDVSYKTLGGRQIDLLTGGFPCQSFSIAGSRGGFSDTRGTLFFDIERLLRDYIENEKPIPMFLLENVKGLLNHDNGRTFATIYRVLSDLNYTLECQLVNTRWFLPQNRERIFIFGRYNGNPSGRKIFPIRKDGRTTPQDGEVAISNSSMREFGWKDVSPALCARDYKDPKLIKVADFRNDEGLRIRKDGIAPCLSNRRHSETDISTMPPLVSGAAIRTRSTDDWEKKTDRIQTLEKRKDDVANSITSHQLDSVVTYNNKQLNETLEKSNLDKDDVKALDLYNRAAKDVSPTLTDPKHNNIRLYDKSRVRRLTPTECERLQGFSWINKDGSWNDGWTDGQSNTQRYKQLGNAISVPVVEEMFLKIYQNRE